MEKHRNDDAAMLAVLAGIVHFEAQQLAGGRTVDGQAFGERMIDIVGGARTPRNYYDIACQIGSAFERRGVDATALMRLVMPGPLSARDFADAAALIQRQEFRRTLREPMRAAAAASDDDAMLSVDAIARRFGEGQEAVRKRLDRWRKKNLDAGWVEDGNASGNSARYLYPWGRIKHLQNRPARVRR